MFMCKTRTRGRVRCVFATLTVRNSSVRVNKTFFRDHVTANNYSGAPVYSIAA